jgi:hypothetical protein
MGFCAVIFGFAIVRVAGGEVSTFGLSTLGASTFGISALGASTSGACTCSGFGIAFFGSVFAGVGSAARTIRVRFGATFKGTTSTRGCSGFFFAAGAGAASFGPACYFA